MIQRHCGQSPEKGAVLLRPLKQSGFGHWTAMLPFLTDYDPIGRSPGALQPMSRWQKVVTEMKVLLPVIAVKTPVLNGFGKVFRGNHLGLV